jgi:uncharacterized protein (TIGR03083 family)
METLSFPAALALIDDRSAALRTAAAAAGMAAPVPGCPDWTVADLVAHLGAVQLFWAADVAAGPASDPPAEDAGGDREPDGDLIEWSADATARLVAALTDAGPDRMCWTWWEETAVAPNTAGAVARHQVQEAGVHAFDAQQAGGRAEPLPPAVAADGVAEYLTVELPTNGPWPYEAGTVVLETGAGGTWLVNLGLGPEGVHVLEGGAHGHAHRTATVTADPSDMVLSFYRRDIGHALQVDGDPDLVPQLLAWPNLD